MPNGGDSQNYYFGLSGFLFGAVDSSDIFDGSKISHDSYKVYVNNDYVGDKILFGQNEKIEDLEKYLKNQGFENFSTELIGNQYFIKPAEDEYYDMKNTLNVYLHTK
ncbi:MAG TPA: hypothetical protein GXX20_01130 [Clostridiaceae bacterium]|nr:hypothetical protein [Clostridiaceae bacterium]